MSAIADEKDIHSTLQIVALAPKRILVEDTDYGKETAQRIEALTALVEAYRDGTVKQSSAK